MSDIEMIKEKEAKINNKRDCIHCGWAMGEREGSPLCDHCDNKR